MVAFLYRMPAGIPGEVNKIWAAVIEPGVITPFGTSGAPSAYGVPLVIDATTGNMRSLLTADLTSFTYGGVTLSGGTALSASPYTGVNGIYPYGILVRPFPTGGSQDPLGTSTPPASGSCDVLKSGYINVLLSGSVAAVKGGQVYVWVAAASGTHILGGWESSATGGSTVLVPNCYFNGPADAAGNTEIAFNV